jgi:hypothetical protein
MKILYKNLPFKTNRNVLAKMNAGINAPNNLNNRLANKVQITTLHLPSVVYHMSLTPIREFIPNRIFYVSFSKDQAFLHVSQYLRKLQAKYNNKNDTKIYLYTLKPKKQNIQAIVFDKNHRPKNISNAIGLKFNTFSQESQMKMSFGLGVTKNNINSANFKEGSGDNMLLGHLLCSKTGINGIRNTINQDELAICNPKNFFTVFDREVLDVGYRTEKRINENHPSWINYVRGKKPKKIYLPPKKGQLSFNNSLNLPRRIEFRRNVNGEMKYIARGNVLKLLHKYGTSKIQEARAKQALSKLTGKIKFGNILTGKIQ